MQVSVLLCTHQPRPHYLAEALQALRAQAFPLHEWELIVVDNACVPPLAHDLVAWHPHGRIVREPRLGLTLARVRGLAEARAPLVVFCDDDNLLAPNYLAQAASLFGDPALGAAGGKSLARYDRPPPAWFLPFAMRLAVRDLGPERQLASWKNLETDRRAYPACAPIGAGLVMRGEIARHYAAQLDHTPAVPDRVGSRLSSGGDAALVLESLSGGWIVGYFPELILTHLIPEERVRLGYLARLNHASSQSWVQVLAQHQISPWKPIPRWTVGLRALRAFFRQQAWRGAAHYLHWAGACGIFAGQARVPRRTSDAS